MNARTKDPMLLPQDCLALLATKLQFEEGSIDLANASIYFDQDHEEPTGYLAGSGEEVEITPSFILVRHVNGKRVKSAHPTLADAIRGLE